MNAKNSRILMAMLLSAAGMAHAQPVVHDGFTGPIGTLSGQGGGVGWSGNWAVFPGYFDFDVSLFGLKYETIDWTFDTSGGAARYQGEDGLMRRNLINTFAQLFAAGSGRTYMSFLIKQGALSDTLSTWLGVKLPNGVYIGKHFASASFTAVDAGGNLRLAAAGTPTLKRTSLVLVEFIDRPTPANDTMNVYINPPLGTNTLPVTPDIASVNVGDLANTAQILLEGGGLFGSQMSGRIDELRIGRTPLDVLRATVKPARCARMSHGISVTPRIPGQLADVIIQERYRVSAFARSRTCKSRAKQSSGWIAVAPGTPSTLHRVDVTAGDPGSSTAFAEAGITVPDWNDPDLLQAFTFTETGGSSTTAGCNTNRRKKASASRASAFSKVRAVDAPSGDVLRNTNGHWAGRWRNCAGSSFSRHPRVLRDPVTLSVTDRTSGVRTDYPILDISSLVWSGETAWTIGPETDGPRTRILENTSPDMVFTATVGSAALPDFSQYGSLRIRCFGGVVTELIATGRFAYVHQHLTLGQPSTFIIPLPEIAFEMQTPQAAGTQHSTLEGGGGITESEVGPDAIAVGCELTTDIGTGFDSEDVSAPQGLNVAVGFPVSSIAQEFTVPPIAVTEVSVNVPVYQAGFTPSNPPPSADLVIEIWSGRPGSPGATMLHQAFRPQAETEWMGLNAAFSAASDAGAFPIYTVSEDLSASIPPGNYWIVLNVIGDPSGGPLHYVPCRHSVGAAWTYDPNTNSATPILDPGSGQQMGFPIDIYAGEEDPNPCPADFNQDGFLDFFDYDAFVACFEGVGAPGCDADFNLDGFVDFFDYDAYVTAFETGC